MLAPQERLAGHDGHGDLLSYLSMARTVLVAFGPPRPLRRRRHRRLPCRHGPTERRLTALLASSPGLQQTLRIEAAWADLASWHRRRPLNRGSDLAAPIEAAPREATVQCFRLVANAATCPIPSAWVLLLRGMAAHTCSPGRSAPFGSELMAIETYGEHAENAARARDRTRTRLEMLGLTRGSQGSGGRSRSRSRCGRLLQRAADWCSTGPPCRGRGPDPRVGGRR